MFWGKKEAPKKKTFDQLSPDELKEFQNGVKKDIQTARRDLDRQVFNTERMIKESQRDLEKKIKENAPKNVLRIYAKNVVSAQKMRDKQILNKTKLQSLEMSVNQMFMSMKMGNVLKQSAEITGVVNRLINVPELANTMTKMQGDMEKMGILGEMMEDAMDELDTDVDVDVEADRLIDNITDQVTGATGKAKVAQKEQKIDVDEQIKNLSL